MKILTMATTFLILISSTTWAKVEFSANQLLMKNSDQVSELVRKKIKLANEVQSKQDDSDDGPAAEPEAVAYLQDAMRIALSRPDQDGLRSILFGRLRRELNDLEATDQVLMNLAHEAVDNLKEKRHDGTTQATYIVLLENLMSEIKPEIDSNKAFRQIIEYVRDAKIKITDDMKSKEMLTLMQEPQSPSKTAQAILDIKPAAGEVKDKTDKAKDKKPKK